MGLSFLSTRCLVDPTEYHPPTLRFDQRTRDMFCTVATVFPTLATTRHLQPWFPLRKWLQFHVPNCSGNLLAAWVVGGEAGFPQNTAIIGPLADTMRLFSAVPAQDAEQYYKAMADRTKKSHSHSSPFSKYLFNS